MGRFEITTEVETDDFLAEVDDDDLIEEIEYRGYHVEESTDGDGGGTIRNNKPVRVFYINRDADRHELLDHLLDITELNHYASTEQVLEALKEKLSR